MGEITYVANATNDQEKALEECVKWAIDKYALVSIVCTGEEKGHFIFTITYTDELAQSGDSKLQESGSSGRKHPETSE